MHQQQTQQPQPGSSLEARLERQEARLDGFGNTLKELGSAITSVSDKLDRKSQPQWQVYLSALTVMLGILAFVGTAWKSPIEGAITRQETDIHELQRGMVKREDHERFWKLQDRDYDFMRDRIGRIEGRAEKRSEDLSRRLERIEDRVVSRSELTGRFEAQDRIISVLRGELDEHIRAFNERQQRRIDALEPGPRR